MTQVSLDHVNRLTIMVDLGENATHEELYGAVEKLLQERREALKPRPRDDGRAFLEAEQSYLEVPS